LDAGVGNVHQQGRFYGTSIFGSLYDDHLHFSIENSGIVLSFFGIGSVIGSWLGG
jgi:predicted MFS family arabinose efflux permease